MSTNEDIIKKRFGLLPEEIRYATTKEIAISKILEMLKEARSDEKRMIIDAVWNWWNTKPQHLFITTQDIKELVNMLEKAD